jgi:hypothetical protein
MSESLDHTMEMIGEVFGVIFILECALKILFFSYESYFRSKWDRLDFYLVITGIIASFIDIIIPTEHHIWVRVIKSFRVLRIFRLIRKVH